MEVVRLIHSTKLQRETGANMEDRAILLDFLDGFLYRQNSAVRVQIQIWRLTPPNSKCSESAS